MDISRKALNVNMSDKSNRVSQNTVNETKNDDTASATLQILKCQHTLSHSELSVSYTSREHAGLSGHAVPVSRPKNQMSPKFGAEVLGTPRPPLNVDTKPLPNVLKTPRRLGVVPL